MKDVASSQFMMSSIHKEEFVAAEQHTHQPCPRRARLFIRRQIGGWFSVA